ncbi:MAG: hypothetical protein U1C74_33530, partial [Phenylobacterium sp.]|nr:hypothetical protein [Phenylobacterium sp.]
MTPPSHGPTPEPEIDSFLQAVLRRARARSLRIVQALLVAALAWIGFDDPLVAAWLAVTLMAGLAEERLARAVILRPDSAGARRRAALGQAMAALTFSSIAVVIMAPDPGQTSLAGAAVVLCAISLCNATQSRGSRLATLALVTPPSALLTLCPFLIVATGPGVALGPVLLLAVGGLAFSIFIVHLSASLHAESAALRIAHQAASSGGHRWRMIFRDSPMAYNCFDASAVFTRLRERARGRTLGEALLETYPTTQALHGDVAQLEVNEAARDTFDRIGGISGFSEDFMTGFAGALDRMSPDGRMPAFDTEFTTAAGDRRVMRIRYRLTSDAGARWSVCLGAYEDVTEIYRVAQA